MTTLAVRPTPDEQAEGPAKAVWSSVMDRARQDLSEAQYELWFADLRPGHHKGSLVELVAPSEYVKGWLSAHYMSLIVSSARETLGPAARVRLRIDPIPGPPGERTGSRASGRRRSASPPGQASLEDALGSSPFPDRYTFETFVPGPSNKFAHAAALAVAEAPPGKAYNPVFIYGGVGLGKTHLLFAIANHMWRLSPHTRSRYVTSESFMTEFIKAVRERRGYQFQRQYRDVDVLLLDDVQFLARAEETQNEFFHTFNHLHQHDRQIVIASDRPPQELGGIEERLRSRRRRPAARPGDEDRDPSAQGPEGSVGGLRRRAPLHRLEVRAQHSRARGRAPARRRLRLSLAPDDRHGTR